MGASTKYSHTSCQPIKNNMDNTDLFKATVKALKLRLRSQQKDKKSLNDALFMKTSGRKGSEFGRLAKEAVSILNNLIINGSGL